LPDFLASFQAALVDRYRFERELGRGGMATVYLARDLKHDRLVAIKLLRQELVAALGPDRFLREIQVTASLQHPHILPLLDSGTIADAGGTRPYYVMPYVQGESLRDHLERERQLPVDEAVRITRDVAAALGYAHERGVVHRDIKPENILLSGGQAVVADFGIARALSAAGAERLTETGLALGTPHYMSPEQASGDPHVDGRADIYALGCVLYEMLAGEPPYTGPTAQAIIAKRMVEPTPRIRTVRESVSEALERAITRALAKTPADRFGTAPEFAEALSPAASAPPVPRSVDLSRRWRIAALLIIGLVGGAAVLRLWSRRSGPDMSPSASLIAVLPFTPSGSDTALSRLGRDLVFTMSSELDGLGTIRVVDAHTVLAQAKQGGLYSPAEGAALARRFGAGSMVHGSLVREGADVRLDFVLLSTDGSIPLARASVSNAPDSIAALTDSAVHVLLRQVWTRGSAPTPSLEAALKTRSVPALRAFLEGERDIIGGLWDSAAASYGRAREADPAFWLAYAREQYALNWSQHEQADALTEALQRHRFELPEPERLTTEAIVLWSQDSIALALERARQLTERYPSSWFGWLIYPDQLLHNGPLLGHSRAEASAGFERALELNADLIPVHEHLMLVALQDRDTIASARGLRELARLGAGPSLTADGYGNRMLQFRFLSAIERGDSALTRVLADSIARDPEPLAVPDGSFYDAYRYGFPAEQIRVSAQVVRAAVSQGRRATHGRLLAFSWAQRGAWDSALVAMDRLVTREIDSAAALESYGLAVVGSWLGAVDQGQADARRKSAVALAHGADRAEVAWLDGLAAVARRDRRSIAQARAALRATGDPSVNALDRSLAAFDASLAGATGAAGTAMANLEWQEAAISARDFTRHPYTIAVDRLAAARWLAASGDADEALRLLTWVDGPYFIHPSAVYSLMLTGLVDLERGRIEEQRGRFSAARNYYREFLRRYDRPLIGHRRLVEEAKTAMVRLTGRGD
jgi:serine/threonine protein kinase